MLGGLELHPSVVHFPVALVSVGALFSVLYLIFPREWLRWFAPVLLSLALLGAVAAYFSGQSAEDRAEALGVPKAAIDQHEDSGTWGLGLTALACLVAWATHAGRRGIWISAVLAVLATGVIFWSGHLGGRLVYVYGAGRVAGPGTAPAPAARHEESEH